MSYGLTTQCSTCKKHQSKEDGKCADEHIIQNAIHAIHGMPYDTVHLGSGQITIDCSNHEPIEADQG